METVLKSCQMKSSGYSGGAKASVVFIGLSYIISPYIFITSTGINN